MYQGSVGYGVGSAVGIHVVRREPQDKTGNGFLVQQSIDGLEVLGFGCPSFTRPVGGKGAVMVGGSLGQVGQVGAGYATIVGA